MQHKRLRVYVNTRCRSVVWYWHIFLLVSAYPSFLAMATETWRDWGSCAGLTFDSMLFPLRPSSPSLSSHSMLQKKARAPCRMQTKWTVNGSRFWEGSDPSQAFEGRGGEERLRRARREGENEAERGEGGGRDTGTGRGGVKSAKGSGDVKKTFT